MVLVLLFNYICCSGFTFSRTFSNDLISILLIKKRVKGIHKTFLNQVLLISFAEDFQIDGFNSRLNPAKQQLKEGIVACRDTCKGIFNYLQTANWLPFVLPGSLILEVWWPKSIICLILGSGILELGAQVRFV